MTLSVAMLTVLESEVVARDVDEEVEAGEADGDAEVVDDEEEGVVVFDGVTIRFRAMQSCGHGASPENMYKVN